MAKPNKRVLIGTSGTSQTYNGKFQAAVDKRINEMCNRENRLPEKLNDLVWLIEEFNATDYGATINQRLARKLDIEKIEAMCRDIGNGGAFRAINPDSTI